MQMQRRLAGWTTLGALASSVIPAIAQVQPQTQEIHGYVGELFGDELTDTQVSGLTPTLDDDVTYGIRYGYNVTQTWGLELSLGYNPNKVTELTGGDSDLDLATLDVDMVWNFNPGGRLVPYALGGVGHASANLDRPIQGIANGQAVSIDDDSSFTLNAGVGVKYFTTDQLLIRLDGRYRYIDKLVDTLDDSLNSFEMTLNVGWQF